MNLENYQLKGSNLIDTRTTDGDYNELTSHKSFFNLCNRQCVFVCVEQNRLHQLSCSEL
jgi:hypothetical protein